MKKLNKKSLLNKQLASVKLGELLKLAVLHVLKDRTLKQSKVSEKASFDRLEYKDKKKKQQAFENTFAYHTLRILESEGKVKQNKDDKTWELINK